MDVKPLLQSQGRGWDAVVKLGRQRPNFTTTFEMPVVTLLRRGCDVIVTRLWLFYGRTTHFLMTSHPRASLRARVKDVGSGNYVMGNNAGFGKHPVKIL